ncbi:hypothetical protein [Ponticaulis sp.]|uniref:hypothetical protein n=1 Tax=Ponticaulis sp. TaxID=2020902 RepID=UPI000C5EBF9F|nr:hypothetical protein [Ponticaulis sp.]MBN04011.1 hypothetical protein [Ponticaulis sp.]
MSDVSAPEEILSYEPREIARRLKGYIAGAHHSAEGDCEAPPEGVQTRRPYMQRRFMSDGLTHVKRLEYLLRCFILFLTAELIALGRFTLAKSRKSHNAPQEMRLAEREDEALRDQLRDLPRLPAFSVLTPVIEARGRKSRGSSRRYTFLPDRLQLVEAGHLFARLKRLSHVLEHADRFALNLARRVVLSELSPSACGEHGTRSGLPHQSNAQTKPASLSPPVPVQTGTHAYEVAEYRAARTKHGHPPARVSAAREPNQIPHLLWFAPLANFCPPEELWASAATQAERKDVNFIHYLASAKLEEIGFGIRPDPYAGLPDLSCLDPPPPPNIRRL